MHQILVVGGGVRSGKSRFALDLARAIPGPRAFIATAQAGDGEMSARIYAHQQERALEFTTIDAPLDLSTALRQAALHPAAPYRVFVIDCFTIWVSNLLLAWSAEDLDDLSLSQRLRAEFEQLADTLRSIDATIICVTNEVGMGVVPPYRLGRIYRDLLGLTNQQLASIADGIYLATLGLVLRLRPGPVEVVHPK